MLSSSILSSTTTTTTTTTSSLGHNPSLSLTPPTTMRSAALSLQQTPTRINDWQVLTDQQSGRQYYHSPSRNETTWDRPLEMGRSHANTCLTSKLASKKISRTVSTPVMKTPTPFLIVGNWQCLKSDDGRDYFNNIKTN